MGTFVLPHLTSRLSVGSWPPKLPRSAFEAHWPPLETRYLGYIRIASYDGVYPLTCAKADGGSVSCVSAINAATAGAVAAAECPSALSVAPSLRPPTLITTVPSKDPKTSSHHHHLCPPNTLCDLNSCYQTLPPYLPQSGEYLDPKAFQ